MAKAPSTETSIALIQKDVSYLRDGMKTVTDTLALMEKDYIKRTEIEQMRRDHEKLHEEIDTDQGNQWGAIRTTQTFMTQVRTYGVVVVAALSVASAVITAVIIHYFGAN